MFFTFSQCSFCNVFTGPVYVDVKTLLEAFRFWLKIFGSFFSYCRTILFHLFDKEILGSDVPLGQVHIDLKHFDLNEPITDWYQLADLVSEILSPSPFSQR